MTTCLLVRASRGEIRRRWNEQSDRAWSDTRPRFLEQQEILDGMMIEREERPWILLEDDMGPSVPNGITG